MELSSGLGGSESGIYEGLLLDSPDVAKVEGMNSQTSLGLDSRLVIERKAADRAYIRCHRWGVPRPRKEATGQRMRVSLKCSCPFRFMLTKTGPGKWKVSNITSSHNHSVEKSHFVASEEFTPVTEVIQTSRDIRLRQFLDSALAETGGRMREGFAKSAQQRFIAQNPGVSVSLEVIQNAISLHAQHSDDCAQFVTHMKSLRDLGKLAFLRYETDELGRLCYTSFSTPSAKKAAERYSDIILCDSTHNTTRYTFKLVTLLVVDSEFRSVPVLFALVSDESVATFQKLAADYMEAFQIPLPPVFMSDGDAAIPAALSTLPKSPPPPTHLLCVWHLIHNDLKAVVAPALPGGSQSWPAFRDDIEKVRLSASVEDAERLWAELTTRWFKTSEPPLPQASVSRGGSGGSGGKVLSVPERALKRMATLYRKREKWMNSFFVTKPTLGIQSTQRCESWHSTLKKCVSDRVSLSVFVDLMLKAAAVDNLDEMCGRDRIARYAVLAGCGFPKGAVDTLQKANLSLHAANAIAEEMRRSSSMAIVGAASVFDANSLPVELAPAFDDLNVVHGRGALDDVQVVQSRVAYFDSNSDSEALSSPVVHFIFARRESNDSSEEESESDESILIVHCGCNYPSRMLLPCAHALCAARELSKVLFDRRGPRDARAATEEVVPSQPSWLCNPELRATRPSGLSTAAADLFERRILGERRGPLLSYFLFKSINPRWFRPSNNSTPRLNNLETNATTHCNAGVDANGRGAIIASQMMAHQHPLTLRALTDEEKRFAEEKGYSGIGQGPSLNLNALMRWTRGHRRQLGQLLMEATFFEEMLSPKCGGTMVILGRLELCLGLSNKLQKK